MRRSASTDDFRSGGLGVPDDPTREFEEIQEEILTKKNDILRKRETARAKSKGA